MSQTNLKDRAAIPEYPTYRQTPSSDVLQMVTALQQETIAVKANSRNLSTDIFDGTYLGPRPPWHLYTFKLGNFIRAADDCPVTVRYAKTHVAGQIVHLKDLDIVLALENMIGQTVEQAQLATDPTFLYKLLEKSLLEKCRSDGFAIADELLDGDLGDSGLATGARVSRQFNRSQAMAVRKALGSTVSFIWGPPGTGKTQTVAHIVRELLSGSHSVLIVAHANAAVDQAALAVARLLKGKPAYRAIVRYGNIQNDELQREFGDIVVSPGAHAAKADIDARLASAHAVFTTLTKCFSDPQIPDRLYDTVIVDETSMAPIPHVYWAVGHAYRHIVFAGDFLQLGPICLSQEPEAQKWLAESLYSYLDLNSLRQVEQDEHVTLLSTQYRMHPDISSIPNMYFYGGLLKDAPETCEHTVDDRLTDTHLGVVNTADICPACSRSVRLSRFNVYEAAVVTDMVVSFRHDMPTATIGVIAPYRDQVRLIYRMLQDRGLLDDRFVRVATVHRFQGGEADIVLFDLVEGKHTNVGVLFDEERSIDAARLLNVALTRARCKLYLIGNVPHVHAKLPPDSKLATILGYCMQHGQVLKSKDVMSSRAVYSTWQGYLARIAKAEKEVVLVTPNLANPNVKAVLEGLIATGIQLIVLSNARALVPLPRAEMPSVEEYHRYSLSLMERGVRLQLRFPNQDGVSVNPLYQNVAVVDNDRVLEFIEDPEVDDTPEIIMGVKGAACGTLVDVPILHKQKDMTEDDTKRQRPSLVSELVYSFGISPHAASRTVLTTVPCPDCGRSMYVLRGQFGYYLECSNPLCRQTAPVPFKTPLTTACPRCGRPLVLIKSHSGKWFLGCSGFSRDDPDSCPFMLPAAALI